MDLEIVAKDRTGDIDLGIVGIAVVMEAWKEDGVAHRTCEVGVKKKDKA